MVNFIFLSLFNGEAAENKTIHTKALYRGLE